MLQIALWLFLIGVFLSLLLGQFSKRVSIYASGFIGIIAACFGTISAILTLLGQSGFKLALPLLQVPLVGLGLTVDPLAAFFILLICGAAIPVSLYSIGYLQAEYLDRPVGVMGALYHLFLLSMLLVVTSGNALLFLFFGECMALISFFLVIFDTASQESQKAGFLYLIMTHVGTAFILLLFLMLWQHAGSLDFAVFAAAKGTLPLYLKHLLFVFALMGFGAKAGIVPLHIWLPEAHPAAPSHISALMSGVMIKTAIYAFLRCLFDFLAPIPFEWGLTILVLGLVTALLGIVYASTEGDLKRLLAYSSIENMGIILLALGLGLVFQSLGHPVLAGIALVSGFLHMLNHSFFKGLLFMAAGAVLSTTHTRSLDNLGGLIHRMPQTAFFFLIGSLAICAFPPFNGFVSEWLIYQSLLSSIQISSKQLPAWLLMLMPFSAVVLGLIGALAAATFVKAFSTGFLAIPRSHHAIHAREVSLSMRLAMGIFALLCLLFGISPATFFPVLNPIIFDLTGHEHIADVLLANGLFVKVNPGNPVSFSPALIFILLMGFLPLAMWLPRFLGGKTGIRKEETWSCGLTAIPEFEYTSTGFSQPLEWVYGKLHATIHFYDRYLYVPVTGSLIRLSHKVKNIQAGSLQLYLVYIFCTLILCLGWIQL